MNFLHFGSLNPLSGGPAMSTALSIRGIKMRGHVAELWGPPLGQEMPVDDTIVRHEVALSLWHPYLTQRSLRESGEFDLYHIQGCWMYGGHAMSCFARRTGKPYVITLRGMLYPQALAKAVWKKRLALWLYQTNDLKHAACIQATCQEEANYYRQLGFRNPVAVIPNAIELSPELPKVVQPEDIFRVGYLA